MAASEESEENRKYRKYLSPDVANTLSLQGVLSIYKLMICIQFLAFSVV